MLKHHPSPELLADYVAGGMRLSHSLCLATHLELCPKCREYVHRLNTLGGCLFQQQTGSTSCMKQLKNKVLATLDQHSDTEAVGSCSNFGVGTSSSDFDTSLKYRHSDNTVPRPLQQFFNEEKAYSSLSWVTLSPSIKVATLLKDKDGTQIALTRVKPGGKMPHHSHTGDELTVVLQGSFSDESGIYRRGDFVYRDVKDRHKPVVTNDAECICLMVLDAPIQFTGWFTRVLNPFLRKNHGLSARHH